MRSIRKLRSVAFADQSGLVQGCSVEGVVIGLGGDGKAKFRDEDGEITEVRVPRHADRRWLEAAARLAPVPAE